MSDPIVQNGDPVLREMADAVCEEQFGSPELTRIIERMSQALDKEQDGVALAAPQIGIALRIFIVRHDRLHAISSNAERLESELGIYINPLITRVSRRREEMEEGCLSVRAIYGKTFRHERATVRARMADGTSFERGAGGILAQAFQHEIDHLDGILFIDHAHDLITITPENLEQLRNESHVVTDEHKKDHGEA